MSCWITIFLALLVTASVTESLKGHRNLEIKFSKSLGDTEEVVITGRGTSKWRTGSIRFVDTQSLCNGRIGAVNPLVLILESRKKRIKISKKTVETGCKDGPYHLRSVPAIGIGREYTIRVKVTQNGYRITVRSGTNRERTIISKEDSLGSVDIARVRSGHYFSLKSKRAIGLPLVRDCGVRNVSTRPMTRIAGGVTAAAGKYPWQAAIRKTHVFKWNPIRHLCGGTLIDSCWILTAGHCTAQIRDREEDYYVRVGDFDNSNHSRPLSVEDQQDLAIDKVFLHQLYNETSKNSINDVSLIRLKPRDSAGTCSTFSKYVIPACLPVAGNDTFTTNTACEISGWGASAYQQSVSQFPTLLKTGDVFLSDFEECKIAFKNGTDGKPRVREGMLCAGGEADTCQGDSGGPLACQRNRARPKSPFVVWGVTSWGDKCATTGVPGVYTDVLHYMPWIQEILMWNTDYTS